MSLEDVYKRNLQHRTHRAGWLRAAVLGAKIGDTVTYTAPNGREISVAVLEAKNFF
jgi:hypothetical protein